MGGRKEAWLARWSCYADKPNDNSPRGHVFIQTFKGAEEIDHILGYKTSLGTFKGIQVIQSIFSDQYGIKLEINNRKIYRKSPHTWKLNFTLINNP